MSYKGYKASPETRETMRKAKLGTKMSKETRLKMSKAHKGRVLSDQAKANIKRGIIEKRYSPEYAKKLSDTKIGDKNPKAKLTWEIVRKIRAEYVPRQVSQQALADKYNVHRSTVADIVNHRCWIE